MFCMSLTPTRPLLKLYQQNNSGNFPSLEHGNQFGRSEFLIAIIKFINIVMKNGNVEEIHEFWDGIIEMKFGHPPQYTHVNCRGLRLNKQLMQMTQSDQ